MSAIKLVSPLARRLAHAHQLDVTSLRGSGPRGRVMADDVKRHLTGETVVNSESSEVSTTSSSLGKTSVAADLLPQTRPAKGGYFVYDCRVDMFALANLSRPIAVQCDRLLESRYSLMDYIVRAVVKSCTTLDSIKKEELDVLLFEEYGKKLRALKDVSNKSLYQLARMLQTGGEVQPSFTPQVVVCDAKITREQVSEYLDSNSAPLVAFVTRGDTQKVGIRVGCDVKDVALDYTFYVSSKLPSDQADSIAARLRNYLYDPVSLLLID